MKARWALLAPLAAVAVAACIGPFENTDSNTAAETNLDKADWLEKASRVLRGGDGLGSRDDMDALMAMSKEDVVDQWMQDPRFGDSVLAFNMYYLGRAIDRVKAPIAAGGYKYDNNVLAFPQALAAAQAVVNDGNYYDIYSGRPPVFRTTNGTAAPAPTDGGLSERESFAAQLDQAIAQTATDRTNGCTKFTSVSSSAITKLGSRGFSPPISLSTWTRANPAFPRVVDCRGTTIPLETLLDSMRTVRNTIDGLFGEILAKPIPAKVMSINDVPALHAAADGFPPLVPALSSKFFSTLPATSTNNQRKRAAFMLKTYFCDDLTPLSIPAPTGDGGADQHASNAACQTCHYRLDPMGALFRNLGKGGTDFGAGASISFDDDVRFSDQQYTDYLNQWRNPDGSWRAGYFVLDRNGKPQREPGWTDADGDTMDGLWSYLPKSKVVKACLVRRLAEYVLGPKQVYDREWLDEISTGLENGPHSGAQFKSVLKTLVLSKTFSTNDPRPGVCYDAPSNAPANRSPCAIAYVVNTNCTGCHNSPEGPGHLDFTNWKEVGGGQYFWAHTDARGQQLPREESLQRMLARITSTDPNKKMPFRRAMAEGDVQTFSNWLNSELEGSQ